MTPVKVFWLNNDLEEQTTYLIVKGKSMRDALNDVIERFNEDNIIEVTLNMSFDDVVEVDEEQYKYMLDGGIYYVGADR